MKNYRLSWKDHLLHLGPRTLIMGIVNVTPDSFSDGGRYHNLHAAAAQAEHLIKSGADIIDIGGESTRPFARPVDAQEELDRVLPVIEKLAGRVPVPISIDTNKAVVAEAALKAGAALINDISALRMDARMGPLAAEHDVPVVLMHMLGEPRTMQVNPVYKDVVGQVRRFLRQAIDRAVSAGIQRDKVIVDPGIGFGKTLVHNLLLLQQLYALAELDVPILVGPSRKAFIRKILTHSPDPEPAPDSAQVETGTQAAVAAAVMNGAHIVRVHDVASARALIQILDAVRNAAPEPDSA
jgi:dihydropteroate synthase